MTQKQKQKLKNSLNGDQPEKNKRDFQGKLRFINKLLLLLILFSSVYFIVSINDLSIKGFVLEDLKKQAKELEKNNQNLELSMTELKSYDNIIARTKELQMVKVDKIDYITVINGGVAKK